MVYYENPKTYNIKLIKEHVSDTIQYMYKCDCMFLLLHIEHTRNVYIMYPNSHLVCWKNITHKKMIKYTD